MVSTKMKKMVLVLLAFLTVATNCFGNSVMISNAAESEVHSSQKQIVVALDPGHDSKHGGATANGLKEHILTLKIANYCKEKLEANSSLQVYMTRTEDVCPYPFAPSSAKCIERRADDAAAAGASVYVSFHLNAQERGTTAKGVETIYPNSNWKPKVGEDGKRLAEKIQEKLVGIGLYDRGVYKKNSTIGEKYPDGSASDYYNVQICNKENGVPGIIIEQAFITNTSDVVKYLQSDAGLKKLGEAIADGILAYLNINGVWKYIDGDWYYYINDMPVTGWLKVDGIWYYMNTEGKMQIGWLTLNGTTYYLTSNGAMQVGMCQIDGEWYYFNSSGAMQTGWCKVNGTWYYMDAEGKMQTGWLTLNGTTYYLAPDGAMQTGLCQIDNKWYCFNSSGALQTGWQTIDGEKYYADSNGEMQTGWHTIDGTRYLLDGMGRVVDGAKYFVIDVSQWQGTIDWDRVAGTGIDGVIVRCSHGDELTENGDSWKDSKFKEYIEALNARNIPYGIYHYNKATTAEQARQQALNMIHLIKDANAVPTFPVFADIEQDGGNCDLVSITKVYMDEIVKGGYMPGIYANSNYWDNYLNDPTLNAYYKWVANYGTAENKQNGTPSPTFFPKEGIKNYMMWQYTPNGVLAGITENTVDCNVMYEWNQKPDGWKQINNKWFYYSSGYLTTGWKAINGYWYYFADGGVMQTGWRKVNGTWYYMKANGRMQTGWLTWNGSKYYLASNGAMQTGFCRIDGKLYYFNSSGAMQTGWCKVNGIWYYMDASGKVQTGWCKVNGIWYYMDGSGAMQTGWRLLNGTWYYMDGSGAMQTGWLKYNGAWYYLNASGAMVTGDVVIDGVTNHFNSIGVWLG